MTGRPRSDRAHVWQQRRRTGAQAVHGPRHGPGRWLAVAGYAGLALVCLAIGALTFVLVAPPLDRVRDRLVDEVKARTGRTLVVAGPMSVTLFPRMIVSLGDVAMLPPEGVEGAPTITVPTLDVETSLRSLVSRRPRLDRLTLHRPTIELVIDAQGRRSWDFAVPSPRAEPPRAAPPGGSEGGSEKASPGLSERMATIESITYITSGQPRPWAVRVVGGIVRYHDERTGVRQEIGGLNLDLAGDKRSGPVNAQGTLTWHGEPWRFSAAAAHEVLAGRPGTVTFNLAGAPVEAAFQGTLAVKNAVAADGSLSLGPFTYRGLKVGPSVLAVSMAAGTAKATLQQVELYGGTGQGTMTLDTTGPAPAIATSLKLTGVSLLPLLGDTADIGWLDGRGTVALDLAGQGSSEPKIVETLQGKVQVAVADGAITGIDIDRSLRALQRGRLDRLAPRREDRTAFSELSGTFDIANGVARNQDLKLASASLQLSGEGTIELAPRRIDYTLQTKIAGGPADDAAAFRVGTIELPVGIKGPLDRPEFSIKGQEGLTDTIKQIGRNLRSREVQDAIKGLLGGDGEKRVKPGELIEKLLRKE